MLAFWDGSIGVNKLLNKIEIVTPYRVTHVNGSTANGSRSGMEFRAQMVRLKHVPIGMDDLAHPHAVVGTVNHMNSL